MSRIGALVAGFAVAATACAGQSDEGGSGTDPARSLPVESSGDAEPPSGDQPENREVVIDTPVGETAATFVVASSEPGPVVLLIAGSGPTDRDGNSALLPGPIDTLAFIADGLADHGVSSIRFDKIGVGASEVPSDPSAVTFDDFVVQADAVRDWVEGRPEVDPTKVVLAGHSEGALIASVSAVERAPAGLALMTPTGSRYLDLVRSQVIDTLDADAVAELDRLIAELRTDGELSETPSNPTLASLFAPASLDFLVTADARDPVDLAAAVDDMVPTLVVCGTVDVQVSCGSLEPLRSARSPGVLTDLVLDGVNHVLRRSGADGGIATYTDASLPHAGEVVEALVELTTEG